jgi:hypothetical protein
MFSVYLGHSVIATGACEHPFRTGPTIATRVRFPSFVALREVWHRLEGLIDDMRAQLDGHANADGDEAMLVAEIAESLWVTLR